MTMSSKDVVKGMISGLLGILIAMIGSAPIDTYPRFTFGVPALESGINSTVVLIGIFAIAEIFVMSENAKKEKVEETVTQNYKIKGLGFGIVGFFMKKWGLKALSLRYTRPFIKNQLRLRMIDQE